ncbi:hypothetical protein ACSBR2_040809 [Camellia fascicularis]
MRLTIVLQGKAITVRLVCAMARAFHCASVEIESDCKIVIQLCMSKGVPPWEICAMMNDIRLMANSGGLAFKWCPDFGIELHIGWL